MDHKKSIQKTLFESIQNCDTDKVQQILSDHPELVNAKFSNQELEVLTPLIEACRFGEFLFSTYTLHDE